MTRVILTGIITLALLGLLLTSAGCTAPPAPPSPALPPSGAVTTTAALSDHPPPVAFRNRTLVVGIDGDYRPFSYISPDGSAAGFDVDSMRWIAEKEGLDVRFRPVAWDSIIPALRDGNIDIIYSAMTITPERAGQVNFSTPYWELNHDVIARSGSDISFADVEAGNVTIGAQNGSVNARWVEKNLIETEKMPKDRLVLYSGIMDALDDLLAGNVDVVIADDAVLKTVTGGKPVRTIGTIPVQESAGIAVRKTDPELLATLDDGLARLKADPYWQELVEKYNLR